MPSLVAHAPLPAPVACAVLLLTLQLSMCCLPAAGHRLAITRASSPFFAAPFEITTAHHCCQEAIFAIPSLLGARHSRRVWVSDGIRARRSGHTTRGDKPARRGWMVGRGIEWGRSRPGSGDPRVGPLPRGSLGILTSSDAWPYSGVTGWEFGSQRYWRKGEESLMRRSPFAATKMSMPYRARSRQGF